MKIAVLSLTDSVMQPVADITFPVMQRYCDTHGYTFRHCNWRLSDRRVVWDKIKMLDLYLSQFDLLVWLDADILITNHQITLESIMLSSLKNMLVGSDENGINTGFLALWNCAWSKKMLERAWDIEENEVGSEQEALTRACAVDNQVFVLPQSVVNSYDWPTYGLSADKAGQWDHSFILHLPGHTAEKRVEIFNKYLDKIIWA